MTPDEIRDRAGSAVDFVIVDVRATTVSVPLEAPLRHAVGAHWGRFVRTIVEVETSDGYTGLGEMGGGGEDATRAFAGLEAYLAGHDVFALEALRLKICNPTASLYNNRTQLHAAIEFACLDVIGKKLGVPVHALLGGKLRDRVAFASYLAWFWLLTRYLASRLSVFSFATPLFGVAFAQRARGESSSA